MRTRWKRWLAPLCVAAQITSADAQEPAVRASSEFPEYPASAAMDGDWRTRWAAQPDDPQWIQFDFGKPVDLVGVIIDWETAFASEYQLMLSDDGTHWQTVFEMRGGKGGRDTLSFPRRYARYLRLYCTRRGTNFGYSLFELDLKTAEAPWGVHQSPHWFAEPFTHGTASFFIPQAWSNTHPFIQLNGIPGSFSLSVNGHTVYSGQNTPQLRIPLSPELQYDAYNRFEVQCTDGRTPSVVDGILLAADDALFRESMIRLQREQPMHALTLQARLTPAGCYPPWLRKRQRYWTVVGVEEDTKESLFAEDGDMELYKSFSITPFVRLGNQFITARDTQLEQSLRDGFLPMPRVTWRHPEFRLHVDAWAWGPPEASSTYITYRLQNTSTQLLSGTLYLAIRPYEVNPPWQWGGLNRIDHLHRKTDGSIQANEYRVVPCNPPTSFAVASPDDGDIVHALLRNHWPETQDIDHPYGLASGALAYAFRLEPRAVKTVTLALPLHDASVPSADPARTLRDCTAYWRKRLTLPLLSAPDDVLLTLKANLAYILINRDGPAIQPGSRSYEASWIRDAAGTGRVLLRLGFTNEVRRFINWYGHYFFDDGRVPAIVIHNRNEVNPVKEFDSQGEWLALLCNYYRSTGDKTFLQSQWTNTLRALQYLENIRQEEERPEYLQQPGEERYYGLLPKSVSHEGYYPEPGNHSYWDDFWALKGWKDGITLATALNDSEHLPWMRRQEKALRTALYASISNTMAYYRIDYLPGCAELGDYDPSSTAGALNGCDETSALPSDALRRTLDRYLEQWDKRNQPGWTGSFSPYEFRIVPALLQTGRTGDAHRVFNDLMKWRIPAGWKQWPEAVYAPPETPGYIGDMPHTWAGGEFMNAALDLFSETNAATVAP